MSLMRYSPSWSAYACDLWTLARRTRLAAPIQVALIMYV